MFNQLPQEIKLTIFGFLPVIARGKASVVSKEWQSLLKDDILWKPLLDQSLSIELLNQLAVNAKQCFLENPELRAKEIDCDKKGKRYLLDMEIKEMIWLTKTQSGHVKSSRVYDLILAGKLTLEEAINRSSDAYFREKSKERSASTLKHRYKFFDQKREECVKHGLTYEEATEATFRDDQVCAVNQGYDYERIKNLSPVQIKAWMEYELTYEQAQHPHLREDHLIALRKGYDYDDVIVLNSQQIYGLVSNLRLSLEQVKHSWFSRFHVQAIKAGVQYENVKGLSITQVKALLSPAAIQDAEQYIYSFRI